MGSDKKQDIATSKDTSHSGNWFRPQGRGFWHIEAHREYGVAWSLCGLRLRIGQAEVRDQLVADEGDVACARCQATAARRSPA